MKRMSSMIKAIVILGLLLGLGVFLKWSQAAEEDKSDEATMAAETRGLVQAADEYAFQISEVVMDGDLESLKQEELDVVQEYATIELLGYGGEDCLGEISIRNAAIFTQESIDMEEYNVRMENFIQSNNNGEIYTKGKAVCMVDNVFRSSDVLTLHLTIKHELTYVYAGEETWNHCVVSSGYMLELVEEDGACRIYTCQPDITNLY